jgi:MobA/VirD2-like, nuclease domain
VIAKIPKARRMKSIGLMRYLFGRGYRGEHQDPHIVAAAEILGVADGTQYPQMREVIALGHQIDAPGELYGVAVTGGNTWHVSLSNAAEDRELTDQEWAKIARDTVRGMGFEVEGKAPVRWAAVRHGRSAGGFDHIHLVVDLVREDGTKASIWRDRWTMSRLASGFEREYGLSVVGGRAGAGLEGNARAELQRAEREGRAEPVRERLAREVRAAATAAASEAEFVRRLRGSGEILVRPRYAQGGRNEVVGYSVALRPNKKAKQIAQKAGKKSVIVWYGGGRLGPDLTLPRLRESWPDAAQEQAEALAAWRGRSGAGREARELAGEAWAAASEQVAAVARDLARVPLQDRAAWAGAAREAAGVYAALSANLEKRRPGPLAAASRALSYSAQTRTGEPKARRTTSTASLRGVGMVALQTGPLGRTPEGELMLIRAMVRVVRLLGDAEAARGSLARSQALTRSAESQLETLHRAMNLPATGPQQQPDISPRRPGPTIHRPGQGLER